MDFLEILTSIIGFSVLFLLGMIYWRISNVDDRPLTQKDIEENEYRLKLIGA